MKVKLLFISVFLQFLFSSGVSGQKYQNGTRLLKGAEVMSATPLQLDYVLEKLADTAKITVNLHEGKTHLILDDGSGKWREWWYYMGKWQVKGNAGGGPGIPGITGNTNALLTKSADGWVNGENHLTLTNTYPDGCYLDAKGSLRINTPGYIDISSGKGFSIGEKNGENFNGLFKTGDEMTLSSTGSESGKMSMIQFNNNGGIDVISPDITFSSTDSGTGTGVYFSKNGYAQINSVTNSEDDQTLARSHFYTGDGGLWVDNEFTVKEDIKYSSFINMNPTSGFSLGFDYNSAEQSVNADHPAFAGEVNICAASQAVEISVGRNKDIYLTNNKQANNSISVGMDAITFSSYDQNLGEGCITMPTRIYYQNEEPVLADDGFAFWVNGNNEFYLIVSSKGVRKKVMLQ